MLLLQMWSLDTSGLHFSLAVNLQTLGRRGEGGSGGGELLQVKVRTKEETSWHLQAMPASSWGSQTEGDTVFLLHACAMPAWVCVWLWSLEWEREEDAAGAKSQPRREQQERQHFPPWHREGAGAGSQESGREVKKTHNLLSSPLSPSGLCGMKHGPASNDADGVTVRQGQRWGAPMDRKEPESRYIPV